MALIRANTSGGDSGGGTLINAEYKVIKMGSLDDTSGNMTVPNGTDFVIVFPLAFTKDGDSNIDCSSRDCEVAILAEIGDSATFTYSYYNGSYYNDTQSVEWYDATTIKQIRENSRCAIQYMFCQYE